MIGNRPPGNLYEPRPRLRMPLLLALRNHLQPHHASLIPPPSGCPVNIWEQPSSLLESRDKPPPLDLRNTLIAQKMKRDNAGLEGDGLPLKLAKMDMDTHTWEATIAQSMIDAQWEITEKGRRDISQRTQNRIFCK